MFLLVQSSYTLHSVPPHLSAQQLGESVASMGHRKRAESTGSIRDSNWVSHLGILQKRATEKSLLTQESRAKRRKADGVLISIKIKLKTFLI